MVITVDRGKWRRAAKSRNIYVNQLTTCIVIILINFIYLTFTLNMFYLDDPKIKRYNLAKSSYFSGIVNMSMK